MNRQPVSARAVLLLIAAVLILPIAMSLTVALAALLRAMGDETGGQALGYVALACGVLWTLALVCLVVAQAVNALADQPPDKDDSDR